MFPGVECLARSYQGTRSQLEFENMPGFQGLPLAIHKKSSAFNTMRVWFKYAGMFLLVCLVIAFFSRERFESSTPPERPLKLEPPYGNILYTSD
jgi:hypothetical protein